jgi:hypothetical protein
MHLVHLHERKTLSSPALPGSFSSVLHWFAVEDAVPSPLLLLEQFEPLLLDEPDSQMA